MVHLFTVPFFKVFDLRRYLLIWLNNCCDTGCTFTVSSTFDWPKKMCNSKEEGMKLRVFFESF